MRRCGTKNVRGEWCGWEKVLDEVIVLVCLGMFLIDEDISRVFISCLESWASPRIWGSWFSHLPVYGWLCGALPDLWREKRPHVQQVYSQALSRSCATWHAYRQEFLSFTSLHKRAGVLFLFYNSTTPPKFIIAPEKWWWKMRFLLRLPIFRGELLNFRGVSHSYSKQNGRVCAS